MSSATALTGRYGVMKVAGTAVARLTKWSVNPKLATKSEWGDSDSDGYTNRAAGRKDCTFTAEGKFDTTAPQFDLFEEGDIVEVYLYADGSQTVGWHFTRALCDDFKLDVDVDSEAVVGWTSSWGSDGEYARI
jgi:hypothetical protein